MTCFVVNGEERSADPSPTVADLLTQLGLAGTPCAVEINGSVVPRREHESRIIGEGDRVELVTLVGGG